MSGLKLIAGLIWDAAELIVYSGDAYFPAVGAFGRAILVHLACSENMHDVMTE
ncbi:MAG: hypothetical protein H6Q05_3256 [Acidobacteria bacterium]|nr:hypothetical protein [Acidobacteriota bacterium]